MAACCVCPEGVLGRARGQGWELAPTWPKDVKGRCRAHRDLMPRCPQLWVCTVSAPVAPAEAEQLMT